MVETPLSEAQAAQVVAARMAAMARRNRRDAHRLDGTLSPSETVRGIFYLSRLVLEWLGTELHLSPEDVAVHVTRILRARSTRPYQAPRLTGTAARDVAAAVGILAGTGPRTARRLSDGFEGDPGRAVSAYEAALATLAGELGELWGVSDEEVGQRLALRCAGEALDGY